MSEVEPKRASGRRMAFAIFSLLWIGLGTFVVGILTFLTMVMSAPVRYEDRSSAPYDPSLTLLWFACAAVILAGLALCGALLIGLVRRRLPGWLMVAAGVIDVIMAAGVAVIGSLTGV